MLKNHQWLPIPSSTGQTIFLAYPQTISYCSSNRGLPSSDLSWGPLLLTSACCLFYLESAPHVPPFCHPKLHSSFEALPPESFPWSLTPLLRALDLGQAYAADICPFCCLWPAKISKE